MARLRRHLPTRHTWRMLQDAGAESVCAPAFIGRDAGSRAGDSVAYPWGTGAVQCICGSLFRTCRLVDKTFATPRWDPPPSSGRSRPETRYIPSCRACTKQLHASGWLSPLHSGLNHRRRDIPKSFGGGLLQPSRAGDPRCSTRGAVMASCCCHPVQPSHVKEWLTPVNKRMLRLSMSRTEWCGESHPVVAGDCPSRGCLGAGREGRAGQGSGMCRRGRVIGTLSGCTAGSSKGRGPAGHGRLDLRSLSSGRIVASEPMAPPVQAAKYRYFGSLSRLDSQ